MEIMNVTFAYVVQALAVIIILYEVGKKIMELKASSDKDHDRRQRWDKAADIVEKKEKVWDDAVVISGKERQEITDTFNTKLKNQDAKIDKINEMLVKIVKAMNVLLENQVEHGANGDVKSMHTELNNYVVEQFGK